MRVERARSSSCCGLLAAAAAVAALAFSVLPSHVSAQGTQPSGTPAPQPSPQLQQAQRATADAMAANNRAQDEWCQKALSGTPAEQQKAKADLAAANANLEKAVLNEAALAPAAAQAGAAMAQAQAELMGTVTSANTQAQLDAAFKKVQDAAKQYNDALKKESERINGELEGGRGAPPAPQPGAQRDACPPQTAQQGVTPTQQTSSLTTAQYVTANAWRKYLEVQATSMFCATPGQKEAFDQAAKELETKIEQEAISTPAGKAAATELYQAQHGLMLTGWREPFVKAALERFQKVKEQEMVRIRAELESGSRLQQMGPATPDRSLQPQQSSEQQPKPVGPIGAAQPPLRGTFLASLFQLRVAADNQKFCTRDIVGAKPTVAVPADAAGNPLCPPQQVAQQPGTPQGATLFPSFSPDLRGALIVGRRDQSPEARPGPPPSGTQSPAPVTQQPASQPSSPAQPQPVESTQAPSTQAPQPAAPAQPGQPSENPADQTDSVTVHVEVAPKATEAVLQGLNAPPPLGGQIAKFAALAAPDLPKAGASKPAQDAGHRSGPASCVAGADGKCKVHIPRADAAAYGLPAGVTNVAAKVDQPHTTDLVVQKTAANAAALQALASAGSTVATSNFSVGNSNFTRLTVQGSSKLGAAAINALKAAGVALQPDNCIDKAPGPPLGMEPKSYSALDRELPRAELRLDRPARPARRAP